MAIVPMDCLQTDGLDVSDAALSYYFDSRPTKTPPVPLEWLRASSSCLEEIAGLTVALPNHSMTNTDQSKPFNFSCRA